MKERKPSKFQIQAQIYKLMDKYADVKTKEFKEIPEVKRLLNELEQIENQNRNELMFEVGKYYKIVDTEEETLYCVVLDKDNYQIIIDGYGRYGGYFVEIQERKMLIEQIKLMAEVVEISKAEYEENLNKINKTHVNEVHHQKEVRLSKEELQLIKAEQQLTGFAEGRQNSSIIHLITSMGLNEKEWEILKSEYEPNYLTEFEFEQINHYFENIYSEEDYE